MSGDPVRAIAQAVLYEGYLLWPYRRSALKNQHRFTIGGLYPRAYAERFADRVRAGFSVIVEGDAPSLDLELRFLRVVRREALRDGVPVDELAVGEQRYASWDEAREETLTLSAIATPLELALAHAAGSAEEGLAPGAALRRTWERIDARLRVETIACGDGRRRVAVELRNESGWAGTTREEALRRTLAAAHVVLRLTHGAFVSPLEDDEARHDGLWPALVGAPGERTTVLAAPVILGDYPAVAPESPGDLFDGGEIDELLIHSIRALTEDERREICATDPRARELLERSLALAPDELARLHGAVREQRPAEA